MSASLLFESKSKWWVALAALALLTLAGPAQAQPYVYALGKVPGQWQQYLTVINAATNTKGPRIELGRSNGFLLPHAMAIAPDGARIYVVNDFDHTVSVVSTATNTVVDTLPQSLVGTNVRGLAVSPDSQRLYVVGNHQLFIAVDIPARSRIATVTLNQGGTTGVVASPDGSRLYIMATGSNRVVVLNTANGGFTTVQLSGNYLRSDSMTLSPDGRFAYIPQRSTWVEGSIPLSGAPPPTPPRVSVLDTATNTIVATTNVDAVPWHVAVSPNGATVYATAYTPSGAMHRLSPSTHASLGTTAVANSFAVAFLADSTRAYVAARENVFAIDTATHAVTATIPFAETVDGRALAIVTTPPPFTPPPTTTPAAPALAGSVSGTTVSLSWTPAAGSPPLSYILEAGTAPGLSDVFNGNVGNVLQVAATPIAGTYYVRVHGVNGFGAGAASNEVVLTVGPGATLVPGAPTLTGSVSNSTATLAWTPSAGGGVPTSYVLEAGTASGTSDVFSGNVGGGNQLAATVTAGTYYARLRGVNAAGMGAVSNEIVLTVTGCTLPSTPTGLSFTRSGNVVTVLWNSAPGAVEYFLEAGTAPGTRNVYNGTVGATTSVTSPISSGTYYVRVFGVNGCGLGGASSELSIAVP